ncbi:MAG: molybdopterin-dependent oxidoreductase [Actinomycetota bacterium]|nr:molybdopterin-dependent oxidoreductase [Actinomycetota bacterium]
MANDTGAREMNVRRRAFAAGAVGMVVAFGVVELVHGLYQLVPSVLLAVAQRIIELTPGDFATRAVETLGAADIPTLIATVVILTVALAGFLAYLSLRSRVAALFGVGMLAVVALFAAFSEPFIDPVATVLTVLGALGAGTGIAFFLLRASGLQERAAAPEAGGLAEYSGQPPQPFTGRSREAHSRDGIAVSRRNFVLLSGAAAVAGLAAGGAGRVLSNEEGSSVAAPESNPLQPSQRGGPATASSGPETLPRPPAEASFDVPGMPPLITPNEDFYLIDTAISSPRINRDRWTLNIKGAVDNPIELSYDDLLSLPTREADITLSCISNEVGGGLISNARWTGVLLSDVLNEAGMSPDKITSASEQLVGRSADDWTSGFPTYLALDGREALVAFGMNDEELPLKHGYPVRLVVPGLYGYVSATKWLTEIELTDWGFDAYWIKRGWSKEGPILTQSRIDTVKDGDTLSAGTVQIGGIAWAPHRGIERVEVSTDGGETWSDASLAAQLDIDAWRQYVYDWEAQPGEHTLKVRATDGEGETQTKTEAPPHPSGATGYHTIEVAVD